MDDGRGQGKLVRLFIHIQKLISRKKCFDKGMKNIQTFARSSHKRKASTELVNDRGKEDHEGDSGVGLSDAEVEAGRVSKQSSVSATDTRQPLLPQPLNQRRPTLPQFPLYQPPVSAIINRQPYTDATPHLAPHYHQRCHSAGSQTQRGGVSIQSMLLPPIHAARQY